jgi:hypothetical protein
MKKILQVIFMLFIVTFSVPVAFSEPEEYDFILEFKHDFNDEDDENECTIEYDDNSKSLDFDENTEDDEIEKSFNDKLKVSCDENVDEINLKITDSEGVKIYDEDFDNEDRINVEIEDIRYDEDEDWFSIEIKHDFGSKDIDCDLEIDNKEYNFNFDSDDNSDVLTIEKNYDTEIKLSCDDEMDEIELNVYDDDGDEKYSETFTEDDKISYDKDKEDMESTEVIIDMDHDFGNDEISCDLEIDGDNSGTYNFDEDSSSSDLKIAVDIKETVEFECDDKFDEITVRIYNEDGEKVDTLEYKNEDEFEYEVSGGLYDWNVKITHDFETDEEIDCDIKIDGIKTKELELDNGAKISELIHNGNFDTDVEMLCDATLDKIEFSTYFDGGSKPLIEKVYDDELSFEYVQLNAEEQKKLDDIAAAAAAEEERRVAAEQAAAVEAEKLRVAEAKIAAQKAEQAAVLKAEQDKIAAAEKARLEQIKLEQESALNSQNNPDGLSGNVVAEKVNCEGLNESACEELKSEAASNNLFFKIAVFVAVVVLLVGFFAFVEVRPSGKKAPAKRTSQSFTHKPERRVEQRTSTNSKNRDKVNFDFLDKRK